MNAVEYVALGDSIATGTLTYWARVKSYVYFFKERLGEYFLYQDINTKNLAQNGNTSSDLLYKLRYSKEVQQAVEQAGIVTVSIGGNDIMSGVAIPGFTQYNIWQVKEGVSQFTNNLPKIIERIRQLNSGCRLLLMTIYNPYNKTQYLPYGYGNDYGMHEQLERFLGDMNDDIRSHASWGRYAVADSHGLFEQYSKGDMHDVVALYPMQDPYIVRNPHPTPNGHKLLGDLHFMTLTQSYR